MHRSLFQRILLACAVLGTCIVITAEPAQRKSQLIQRNPEIDPNYGRNWNRERNAPPSKFSNWNKPYKKPSNTTTTSKNKRYPKYKLKSGKGWKPMGKIQVTSASTSKKPRTNYTSLLNSIKRRPPFRRTPQRRKGKQKKKTKKSGRS